MQVEAWREEVVTRLNAEFGHGAKQALRDARALIAKDPRWIQMIDRRDAGDHPETVIFFARLAKQARSSGRLK